MTLLYPLSPIPYPLSPIPYAMRFIAITNPVHSVYLVALTQFEQL